MRLPLGERNLTRENHRNRCVRQEAEGGGGGQKGGWAAQIAFILRFLRTKCKVVYGN